jgi:hypothetical protein
VARLLAYVSGMVNQQLLLRNELSISEIPFLNGINNFPEKGRNDVTSTLRMLRQRPVLRQYSIRLITA